jgi:signal peptidase II
VVLLILDQRLKAWAIQTLVDPIVLIPKVFQLHLTWNTGVAFGLFKAWPQAALWASSLLTLGLFLYAWKVLSKQSPLDFNPHWVFLACVSAGALSNGWDRWTRGAVVDFIDVTAIQYPVFNGADALVCVGVAGLLYQLIVTKPMSASTSLPSS